MYNKSFGEKRGEKFRVASCLVSLSVESAQAVRLVSGKKGIFAAVAHRGSVVNMAESL